MTIRELKEKINNLPDSYLDKPVGFTSEYESGFVKDFTIQEEDLYWLGDDDPSQLYTKKFLISDGWLEEEIDDVLIEVHAGDPVIKI